MKLTYLGTAAAEGFPAIFCNCKHCKEARRLGGKNIRTRSQAIINDDLLIDLPADTYSHLLNNGIEGDMIKYLLITHSHSDHLYERELELRHGAYFAHNMRVEKLKILCGEGAMKAIIQGAENLENLAIEYSLIEPFQTVDLGDYAVTALPARHFHGDGALVYIIQSDKTVLYAHDTGYFFEEVFDFIKETKKYFHLISLDCTNVDIPISDQGSHMGIDNINRVVERLKSIGAVDDKTHIVINHFSHNAAPLHQNLEERVKDLGYKVSFDGMTVDIK